MICGLCRFGCAADRPNRGSDAAMRQIAHLFSRLRLPHQRSRVSARSSVVKIIHSADCPDELPLAPFGRVWQNYGLMRSDASERSGRSRLTQPVGSPLTAHRLANRATADCSAAVLTAAPTIRVATPATRPRVQRPTPSAATSTSPLRPALPATTEEHGHICARPRKGGAQ